MAAEGQDFEDVLRYYTHLTEHLRWKNLGHVLAGGNGGIGDIAGKPAAGSLCAGKIDQLISPESAAAFCVRAEENPAGAALQML